MYIYGVGDFFGGKGGNQVQLFSVMGVVLCCVVLCCGDMCVCVCVCV